MDRSEIAQLPANRQDREAWINAYIDIQSSQEAVNADHPLWWAIERFMNLDSVEKAEEAWSVLIGILDRRPPKAVLEILAAGPLEDLIDEWGPHFIDRIEQTARDRNDFRDLLNGVWESGTPGIWGRVQAAQRRVGN